MAGNIKNGHPKQHSKPRQKSGYLSTAQHRNNNSSTKYEHTSN
jgi:hypothetical protein